MKNLYKYLIFPMLLLLFMTSCSAPGVTAYDRKNAIEDMRQDVLSEIYKINPDIRNKVKSAPGYAVFSNVNINVILLSASTGYGVVVDNSNGKKTYMKMGEAGFGLGAGVKDFRALFIFKSRHIMQRFMESGWAFGAHADAAIKAGEKGAAVAGEALVNGIRVYQLTESGLALQATLKGTKYWTDDSLNQE